MSRTSIQVLIVFTSLSLISAMPFLDTGNGLEKFQGEDDFDLPRRPVSLSDSESNLETIDMDMRKTEELINILEQYRELKEAQEGDDDDSRAKRFDMRHAPLARNFRSDSFSRLFPSRVFVASRGKRQRYVFGNTGFPEVKRRRGFTALRG